MEQTYSIDKTIKLVQDNVLIIVEILSDEEENQEIIQFADNNVELFEEFTALLLTIYTVAVFTDKKEIPSDLKNRLNEFTDNYEPLHDCSEIYFNDIAPQLMSTIMTEDKIKANQDKFKLILH